MSYATVLAGMTERLETLTGLKAVLDYVPTSIQTTPIAYSLLESVDIRQSGQGLTRETHILHRIVFAWQNNEGAELELIPYVDSVPAAVRADPQLGGRLATNLAEPNKMGGYAQIVQVEGGWVTIGGTEYRVLDCHSLIIEK